MWHVRERIEGNKVCDEDMDVMYASETTYHCETVKKALEIIEWCTDYHDKKRSNVTFNLWSDGK